MFAALGFADLAARGVDLPLANLAGDPLYAGCGMYACHVVLLCTLLAAALIERDGQRVPWRLGLLAAVVGVFAPLAWPAIHPTAAFALKAHGLGPWLEALAGAAAGAIAGAVAWRLGLTGKTPVPRADALIGPTLAGLFLGVQAVPILAAVTILAHVATTLVSRRFARRAARFGWNSWWVVATLAWILVQHRLMV
jgi:hypothetical protein